MAKRTPRKPRTKAILPKKEQTIVDRMPTSARNNFYNTKSKKDSKTSTKKRP